MAHLPGPGIAVSGRSGLLIRKAPGSDEVVLRGDLGVVLKDDLIDRAIAVGYGSYPAIGEHADVPVFHEPDEQFLDITCLVCFRKDPASAFNLCFQIVFMKEINCLFNPEFIEGAEEKFTVFPEGFCKA